jgi:hypothetical protein
MEETPDEVIVTYGYSAADEHKAIMSDPTRRKMMLTFWAVFPLSYVYYLAKMASQGERPDFMLALLMLAPLSLTMSVPFVMKRFQIKRMHRQKPKGTSVTRRFSSKGLAFSADATLIPWGMVTQVIETRIAFLITDASSTDQVVVPKRALSAEQLTQLRSILAREFQARPKELKLLPAR